MKKTLPALALTLGLLSSATFAQTSTTTTTTTTSNAAQAAAIQQQITAGIENGTLSQTQIQELQAQELQLQSGALAGNRHAAGTTVVPDTVDTAARRFADEVKATNGATRSAPKTTGPDPFTYNSLGPDAYQSQKYKNPAYNVPAYPTSNPLPDGLSQQYSGPSAGAPYGAGYGQQPIPTGTGQGVYAPSVGTGGTATQQGVYVYRPGSGR